MRPLIIALLALLGGAPQSPSTLRLYVLDCGTLETDPAGVSRYHVTEQEVIEPRMACPCFLVVHPQGTMLWDVGVIPDAEVKNAAPNPARYDVNVVSPAVVSRTLESQLSALGYAPRDIRYVAISHAHKDHTGNLNQFASSTWLVRPSEREFMLTPNNERVEPRYYSQLEHSPSIAIDADQYDVFGDGRVVLKAAQGTHQRPGARPAVDQDRAHHVVRRLVPLRRRANLPPPAAGQRIQGRGISAVSGDD